MFKFAKLASRGLRNSPRALRSLRNGKGRARLRRGMDTFNRGVAGFDRGMEFYDKGRESLGRIRGDIGRVRDDFSRMYGDEPTPEFDEEIRNPSIVFKEGVPHVFNPMTNEIVSLIAPKSNSDDPDFELKYPGQVKPLSVFEEFRPEDWVKTKNHLPGDPAVAMQNAPNPRPRPRPWPRRPWPMRRPMPFPDFYSYTESEQTRVGSGIPWWLVVFILMFVFLVAGIAVRYTLFTDPSLPIQDRIDQFFLIPVKPVEVPVITPDPYSINVQQNGGAANVVISEFNPELKTRLETEPVVFSATGQGKSVVYISSPMSFAGGAVQFGVPEMGEDLDIQIGSLADNFGDFTVEQLEPAIIDVPVAFKFTMRGKTRENLSNTPYDLMVKDLGGGPDFVVISNTLETDPETSIVPRDINAERLPATFSFYIRLYDSGVVAGGTDVVVRV